MNSPINIFVIEDSSSLRQAMEEQLKREYGEGLEIYHFDGVEDALKQNTIPDIIFLDHILKQSKKGVDSIPAFLNKFPEVEIAIISGQNDLAVFEDAFEKGAKEYIRKNALFFHSIKDFIQKQYHLIG